jgi:hypothetical protein
VGNDSGDRERAIHFAQRLQVLLPDTPQSRAARHHDLCLILTNIGDGQRADFLPGIAVVKMIHGKANALDIEFCEAIAAQFEALRGSDTRAVVLTGQGPMFSAGVNLIRLGEGGAGFCMVGAGAGAEAGADSGCGAGDVCPGEVDGGAWSGGVVCWLVGDWPSDGDCAPRLADPCKHRAVAIPISPRLRDTPACRRSICCDIATPRRPALD